MAITNLPLSYCANVHPGESFDEAWSGLKRYARPLRERIGRPIAAGIWLTRDAVMEVGARPERASALHDWLRDVGLVCYTANAFPFGNFHARRVKEQVYLPDWTSRERLDYTCRVADLLVGLLPDDADGSISTSPCAFGELHPTGADWSIYFTLLHEAARYLAGLKQRTGRTIRLAIEPEPLCVLETTDQALAFFADLFAAAGPEEKLMREHLGLCFDVCHQAVEFENIAESISRIDAAGIRIQKVHITCALELPNSADPDARRSLARFVEERYLHQTIARTSRGQRLTLRDLTVEHCSKPPGEWLECPVWRVHFHVPVNRDVIGPLRTTRPAVREALAAVARLPYAPHLEVETYTWNVLPDETRARESFDLVAGLQAELTSAQQLLDAIQDN